MSAKYESIIYLPDCLFHSFHRENNATKSTNADEIEATIGITMLFFFLLQDPERQRFWSSTLKLSIEN